MAVFFGIPYQSATYDMQVMTTAINTATAKAITAMAAEMDKAMYVGDLKGMAVVESPYVPEGEVYAYNNNFIVGRIAGIGKKAPAPIVLEPIEFPRSYCFSD